MDSNKFAREAADGGKAEVELGTLATQNAGSADVKAFGQRMIDDHGKANGELEQLAAKKGVSLPQTLSKKHQSIRDKLAKLNAAKFDKAYMKDMVKDHEEDVKAFRKQAKEGSDPDIKAFAAKTLPTLESHLEMAKSTYSKVK
jgi:putative membrane protein